ncbi:MAG: hypothetical protein GY851_35755 [bacterium]|nr:hypothetical protein [bacterium]
MALDVGLDPDTADIADVLLLCEHRATDRDGAPRNTLQKEVARCQSWLKSERLQADNAKARAVKKRKAVDAACGNVEKTARGSANGRQDV